MATIKDSIEMANKLRDSLTMSEMPTLDLRNYHNADWQYDNLVEQIKDFQEALDDEHEIGVMLASFGQPSLLIVTDIGYQNPSLIYFYGFLNGKEAQLIQHISQLNFILTSVPKEDPAKSPRRIGFALRDDVE